jgi:hypothetical protein
VDRTRPAATPVPDGWPPPRDLPGTEAGLQADSPCITLLTCGSELAGRGQGTTGAHALTGPPDLGLADPGGPDLVLVDGGLGAHGHGLAAGQVVAVELEGGFGDPFAAGQGSQLGRLRLRKAITAERATTPGRSPYTRGRSPDRLLGAAWSPGVDGVRGMRGRGAPHHRPTKERRPRGQRYGRVHKRPGRGGTRRPGALASVLLGAPHPTTDL